MTTLTETPAGEATIVMTRAYDAPRNLVWQAITDAKHVAQWWGGPSFTNPVCEMDVRPGGLWRHVMRFPSGHELHLNFVFLEVEKPKRLVWQHVDHGRGKRDPPTCAFTVTLEDLGNRTGWKMVARFSSLAERDAAVAIGFTSPIEASNDRLVDHIEGLCEEEKRT
jgi:uncharacterized protein YndB with AHSA1/START domain